MSEEVEVRVNGFPMTLERVDGRTHVRLGPNACFVGEHPYPEVAAVIAEGLKVKPGAVHVGDGELFIDGPPIDNQKLRTALTNLFDEAEIRKAMGLDEKASVRALVCRA